MEQFKGFQKRNLWNYQLNATRLILKCKQTKQKQQQEVVLLVFMNFVKIRWNIQLI